MRLLINDKLEKQLRALSRDKRRAAVEAIDALDFHVSCAGKSALDARAADGRALWLTRSVRVIYTIKPNTITLEEIA